MSGTAPPPAGGQDQSMDDILASIRRILNEDEAAAQTAEATEPSTPEEPAAEAPELPEAPEPLPPPRASAPEFTPPPMAPPPPMARSGPDPVELTSDMLVTPPSQAASAPRMGMDDAAGLIAPAAAAAAAASVGSLLRAVSSERGSQVYRGGPSIEDVVREEIRPILKDWLDSHLPPLVERLVRAEIERVVNRALP
jgi:cell pole-organizing protein PopZ